MTPLSRYEPRKQIRRKMLESIQTATVEKKGAPKKDRDNRDLIILYPFLFHRV